MSTLDMHQANRNATETTSQSANTAGEISAVLKTFDVLSSRADKHLFKHAYLYFLGFLLLSLLLMIIVNLFNHPLGRPNYNIDFTSIFLQIFAIVGICLILWFFNVWRERVTQALQDIFEYNRIYTSTSQYLEFLKKFRSALRNPVKYLLSVVLIVIFVLWFNYKFNIISTLGNDLSLPVFGPTDLITRILHSLHLLILNIFVIGFMYYVGIMFWSMYVSGQYLWKMSRTFKFKIEPVHPDNCGGLSELGHLYFATASPLLFGSAYFIGWMLSAAHFNSFDVPTILLFLFIILLIAVPITIFGFFRPLWSIHESMLSERKTKEEHYAANIASLREKIQLLLDINQLDEAKTLKEKKEMMEALYIPSPTWPFNIKSKLIQTTIGVGGSVLIGVITGLAQPFIKAILHLP
jgi:hypothetical protein